jgi:hypothetical protein
MFLFGAIYMILHRIAKTGWSKPVLLLDIAPFLLELLSRGLFR